MLSFREADILDKYEEGRRAYTVRVYCNIPHQDMRFQLFVDYNGDIDGAINNLFLRLRADAKFIKTSIRHDGSMAVFKEFKGHNLSMPPLIQMGQGAVKETSDLIETWFKSRGFEVIKNVDEKTGLNDNARPIVETKLMTTITAKE